MSHRRRVTKKYGKSVTYYLNGHLQSVCDEFDGRVPHAGGHVGRKGDQVEPEPHGEVKERVSQGAKAAEIETFSNFYSLCLL